MHLQTYPTIDATCNGHCERIMPILLTGMDYLFGQGWVMLALPYHSFCLAASAAPLRVSSICWHSALETRMFMELRPRQHTMAKGGGPPAAFSNDSAPLTPSRFSSPGLHAP